MINLLAATIFCTGVAPTTPATSVEIEINPSSFSTIHYEYLEGPYKGSNYIQSIGSLKGSVHGEYVYFRADGSAPYATQILMKFSGDRIQEAHISHAPSGMNNCPLECVIDEE